MFSQMLRERGAYAIDLTSDRRVNSPLEVQGGSAAAVLCSSEDGITARLV